MNSIVFVESSDDPIQHGDWSIAWSGWRGNANQMVLFGWWEARRGSEHFYSTTLGVCEASRSLYVLDLSWQDGWPQLTMASPLDEREPVKLRALDVLVNRLKSEGKP